MGALRGLFDDTIFLANVVQKVQKHKYKSTNLKLSLKSILQIKSSNIKQDSAKQSASCTKKTIDKFITQK